MSRVAAALALLAALVSLSCPAWAQPFKGQKLRVQFWGGSDALAIQKYVVEPFEKETGATVVVEHGNTSASIAKVRAQKADPQLDVVMLDDIGVLTLAREGVLDRLDLAKLPRAKEIHPRYVVADGYGIGMFNYITTILYNDKLVSPPPKSWKDLWDPKYRGKVLVTPVTHTQSLLLTVMAAQLNGGGLDRIEAAWPMLERLKPNVHSLNANRAVGADLLKSGEALLSVEIPYYYKPQIEQGYPIAMTTDLEEGFFSITGSVALVKGGKGSRDLAYAFINRALSADAQLGMARDLWYGPTNVNVSAQLSPRERAFMVSTPAQFEKAIQVDRLRLLELRPTIIDQWNRIFGQ